jgi:hypothetical protein
MPGYAIPQLRRPPKLKKRQVQLIGNGDLRLAANQMCWPEQAKMEQALRDAVTNLGYELIRAHPYKEAERHGFISSQKEGIQVFSGVDPEAPIIVAEAVWQYSHHVLPGLVSHKGPILTCANWSGMWPGLVGMLNLNGSLTKAGVRYSTIWSADFTDDFFRDYLTRWLADGHAKHKTSHVTRWKDIKIGSKERKLGEALAEELRRQKAILGVFDEGCMGMFNAIIPDSLLNPLGVFKERLSQSALYSETTRVSDEEATAVRRWMEDRGMRFKTGPSEAEDLTDQQIQQQCKMYIASLRIADDFGCHAIGIQYQQGLKDLLPASDLAEGTLNNTDRPPVRSRDGSRVLYERQPLPHFNEVDECWCSPARCRQRSSPTSVLARPARGSLPGIPAWAAGRSKASAGPARSSGAASISMTASFAWTWAGRARLNCRWKKRSAAGIRRRRSGRSCTPSLMECRATR